MEDWFSEGVPPYVVDQQEQSEYQGIKLPQDDIIELLATSLAAIVRVRASRTIHRTTCIQR